MNEQKTTPKKKTFLKSIIFAVCLLAIAAVTVTCVFAANNWGRDLNQLDDGNSDNIQTDGGNADGNLFPLPDDEANAGNEPVASDEGFALPLEDMEIVTGYTFGKDATLGHYHFHSGIDISAEAGTEVTACMDGEIESIVTGDRLNGTTVTIAHADGIKTVYSYIDTAEGLEAGDTVERGQVIGTVSSDSGAEFALGPHLHFAVYEDGALSDPEDLLSLSQK